MAPSAPQSTTWLRVCRTVAAVSAFLIALTSPVPISAAASGRTEPVAAGDRTLSLPEPTGPYPVGTRRLHLVDESRQDPWKPDSGQRELMTSVYYPSLGARGRTARYTAPEVSRLSTARLPVDVPPMVLSSVRTHATASTPPLPGHRPLLLLSPGFGTSRTRMSGLAEQLASAGYVVATVDHTYEAPVRFPDGRVTECGRPVPCGADTVAELRRVVDNRAVDLSFVLDELTGPDAAWPGSAVVDASRVGVAGHSLGGAAAIGTLHGDPRVDAGVNLDGTYYAPDSLAGLSEPVLNLGNGLRLDPAMDPSWARVWPHLTGWKRELLVRGSGHASFTDWPGLIDQLGVRDEYPPEAGRTLLGSISSRRATRITREYVTSFFDLHLKGRPTRLFEGRSPEFPEVVPRRSGQ